MCLGVNQSEKFHVKFWERRSASHGGHYFFIVREREVLPIEKLGFAKKRDDLGRAAFCVKADLNPNDEVVEIDFTNSGYLFVYQCRADELKVKKEGFHNTTGKAAKRSMGNQLAQNVNVPKWMQKHLMKVLART